MSKPLLFQRTNMHSYRLAAVLTLLWPLAVARMVGRVLRFTGGWVVEPPASSAGEDLGIILIQGKALSCVTVAVW